LTKKTKAQTKSYNTAINATYYRFFPRMSFMTIKTNERGKLRARRKKEPQLLEGSLNLTPHHTTNDHV